MRGKRRTEIIVETHRMVTIRHKRGVVRAWCSGCAKRVRMVTAEQAATIVGVSPRVIHRWIEADQVHFSETPEGSLLICLNSLSDEPINERINEK
jgi:hypothetical protein